MIGHLHLLPDHRPEAGAGHLSRCLSLALAWQRRGGTVSSDLHEAVPSWRDRYRAAGVGEGRPPSGGSWTVIDDYRADRHEQRRLRSGDGLLAVLDDHGAVAPYDCDLVIDQNVGAIVDHRAAAGSRYVMLRPEFGAVRQRGPRAHAADARRILLSVGGAPTPTVQQFADVVGTTLTNDGFEVDLLVGADDVAERMALADLAVAASGSTAYELACLGTPSVLVSVADNQEPVAAGLAALGAAVDVGRLGAATASAAVDAIRSLAADRDRRRALGDAAAMLVDELGADRVVARLRSVEMSLVDATSDDARMLWDWANDPVVRASSFSPEPIPWESHLAWFAGVLGNDDALILLAHIGEDAPVGLIRFDRDGNEARISYSLAASARGTGLGAPLLLAGLDALGQRWPGVPAVGDVLLDNPASLRSFRLAGFEELECVTRSNSATFRQAVPA